MISDIPMRYMGSLQRGVDPIIAAIYKVVADGDDTIERVGSGMYRLGHWNFGSIIEPVLVEEYPEVGFFGEGSECIGVCDSPRQFIGTKLWYWLATVPDRHFVIAMVRLRKEDQPPSGGWRWHKWGAYIGNEVPQCEYLHDEPVIEEAWTFHIYEVRGDLV